MLKTDINERKWELVSSEYLFRRPWLTARRDVVRLPNGTEIPEFYVLEYPDWVNIIAVTADGEFVMIRQYRHGIDQTRYELVAGCVDPGEDPLTAAKRELYEETGFGGGEWRKISVISGNPSTTTNWTHCYVAEGVERVGSQHLETSEDISVHLLSADEVRWLLDHDEIKHGDIRVGFNPDEEIGMGAHHFDVEKFGCDWAYTVDGGDLGDLEYENFNAAGAKIIIKGVSVHTGYAKGKMVNASRLAVEFQNMIPENETPEQTEGYQGFYHLIGIESRCEEAKLSYIIRDHDRNKFEDRKDFIEDCVNKMNEKYGDGTVKAVIYDQYYNMKEKIDPNMHVIDIVLRAMQESGVPPRVEPIRGGTDGAQLSFKGLPCPNIFAGGVNFHGPHEFVSIQVMEKVVKTIVKIAEITEEFND